MTIDPDMLTATVTALGVGLGVGGKAIHMWVKGNTGANGNCPEPHCQQTVNQLVISQAVISTKLDEMPNKIFDMLVQAKNLYER